jgi:hypothetical protein
MVASILLAVAFATLTLLVTLPAGAATPSSGTVSQASPNATWQGKSFTVFAPAGECSVGTPNCEVYDLTVGAGDYTGYDLTFAIKGSSTGDDYGLYVTTPGGARPSDEGSSAKVTVSNPAPGVYQVEVYGFIGSAGDTYGGTVTLIKTAVDTNAPVAQLEAPLRVVMVGFKPGDADAAKIVSQIPTTQRPGVLIPYTGDGAGAADADNCGAAAENTLINHGRCYFSGTKPYLVPVEYKWKPQIVYAPDGFTDALFSAMASYSERGDFGGATYRPYLEKYNTTRGIYRGMANLVQPNALVRFIDGEKTEDWLAANSQSFLGFGLGPKGGSNLGPGPNPGYTVFVLNTWDSPQADTRLNPAHEYHVFKINRIDPDTGTFAGIDWARVWGGRYREMILDLGAAPNPYESETWGNRRRAVFGSDAYDPPLWEYRANAPRAIVPADIADPSSQQQQAALPGTTWDKAAFEFNLARFADEAVSYRFLHSYLYEPRPQTGRYFLSSNIWHDAKADAPWASDLTKLFNQEAVLNGLRTLVPYFSFSGDTQFEYLSQGGANYVADQANLDQAKQDGGDPLIGSFGSIPFTAMNTLTAMNYLDASKDRFLRGSECATTIPDLEVVVEKYYAWALPVIVGGIATNRDGKPWGFLASVNDIFKTAKADKPDDILAAVHPDALGGGLTYTSIHELSHYLGLAHPHDTVGEWKNPATGQQEYWDGFSWTFDSTAAPTTYAFDELKYSILDQETIARGHLAYYLRWTHAALQESGAAYFASGKTTVGSLPKKARTLRQTAIDSTAQAQQLFASFDFVKATFAAQKAWRAAAAYRDLALNLAPGTTELNKGTELSGASSCPSASQ